MNSTIIKPLSCYISILGLAIFGTDIYADLDSDIGYTRLQVELDTQGQSLPDGSGVQVLLAEAKDRNFNTLSLLMTRILWTKWIKT